MTLWEYFSSLERQDAFEELQAPAADEDQVEDFLLWGDDNLDFWSLNGYKKITNTLLLLLLLLFLLFASLLCDISQLQLGKIRPITSYK